MNAPLTPAQLDELRALAVPRECAPFRARADADTIRKALSEALGYIDYLTSCADCGKPEGEDHSMCHIGPLAYNKVAARKAQELVDAETELRFGVHREFAAVRAAIDDLERCTSHASRNLLYTPLFYAARTRLDALEERVLDVTRAAVARSST